MYRATVDEDTDFELTLVKFGDDAQVIPAGNFSAGYRLYGKGYTLLSVLPDGCSLLSMLDD